MTHELYTDGKTLLFRRVPKAYRPAPGGPKTLAWMRAKGFIDKRTIERRTA